jgi:hypothetical protein
VRNTLTDSTSRRRDKLVVRPLLGCAVGLAVELRDISDIRIGSDARKKRLRMSRFSRPFSLCRCAGSAQSSAGCAAVYRVPTHTHTHTHTQTYKFQSSTFRKEGPEDARIRRCFWRLGRRTSRGEKLYKKGPSPVHPSKARAVLRLLRRAMAHWIRTTR